MMLGFRRLAIIDLDPRSSQPLRRGRLQIIFNGEIYNFRELRRELEDLGDRFETEGDAEVILALYERYGSQAPERLRGMFAFAIADEAAGTLFLARDQFGIKPLYYAEDRGTFYFASQVKALKKIRWLSTEPDPAGLVGFHLMGSVPEPFTIYRSMRSVEAGHYLTVTTAGPGEPSRYAHVASLLARAARDDDSNLDELIAEAARDSVRAHLVSDVEVGVLLSAGIDSGALLGLMRDCGQQRVRAFTIDFPELRGTAAEETPLAQQIAARYGAEHEVDRISAEEFSDCAEQIFNDMDQPTVDGINSWFASRMASRAGMKVVLSGLGGDELLGGYSTFDRIPRMHRFARTVRSIPLAGGLARWALRRFGPIAAPGNPKVPYVLDYASTLAGSYLINRGILLPFELDTVLDEGVVREGMDRLRPLERIAATNDPTPGSDIARVMALETSNYMRNQLLRDNDWASMAHTVELRVPFVDWPAFEAIAPVAHRLGSRAGKLALGRAPSLPLPAETLDRPRSGFGVPLSAWLGGTALSRLTSRQWAPRVAAEFQRG
jgi:asparagine synthase (glutamine-hydrolysing)